MRASVARSRGLPQAARGRVSTAVATDVTKARKHMHQTHTPLW